jgi:hypothetical protein
MQVERKHEKKVKCFTIKQFGFSPLIFEPYDEGMQTLMIQVFYNN